MRTRGLMVILVLGFLGGCGKNSEPEESSTKKPEPAKADSGKKPGAQVIEPTEAANALLGAWIKAQNAGSFSSYDQLYAKKFFGVKLSQGRRRMFDRKGWLEDRKAMFDRSFTVAAADVSVSGTLETAVVTFEQTWTSSTYKDVGKKRLLLVNEGNAEHPALKIAQEEMLSSADLKTGDSKAEPSPLEFSHVRPHVGGLSLIIKRGFEMDHVSGPLTEVGKEGNRYFVHRALTDTSVEEVSGSLLGRAFNLYGASGKVCVAQIKRLAARASVTPHFGQVQTWNGEVPEVKKATTAQMALDVWRESAGDGYFTAAELETKGDCSGALWARAQELPAPTLYVVKDGTVSEKMRAALLKRAGNVSLTAMEKAGDVRREEIVRTITGEKGEMWTHYSATGGGCGNYLGVYWELMREREGAPLFLTKEDESGPMLEALSPFEIKAAFDLDSKGQLELVAGDVLLRLTTEGFFTTRDASPPYHDCPC